MIIVTSLTESGLWVKNDGTDVDLMAAKGADEVAFGDGPDLAQATPGASCNKLGVRGETAEGKWSRVAHLTRIVDVLAQFFM